MNCQFKELLVSVSGIGSDLSGEHLTIHVHASSESKKLLVGRLDIIGKSTSTFKSSITALIPENFNVSAEIVDKYGLPFNAGKEAKVTVKEDIFSMAANVGDNIDASEAQLATKKNVRELIVKITCDVTPCLDNLEALKAAITDLGDRIRNSDAALKFADKSIKSGDHNPDSKSDDLKQYVRQILLLELFPGGILHRNRGGW